MVDFAQESKVEQREKAESPNKSEEKVTLNISSPSNDIKKFSFRDRETREELISLIKKSQAEVSWENLKRDVQSSVPPEPTTNSTDDLRFVNEDGSPAKIESRVVDGSVTGAWELKPNRLGEVPPEPTTNSTDDLRFVNEDGSPAKIESRVVDGSVTGAWEFKPNRLGEVPPEPTTNSTNDLRFVNEDGSPAKIESRVVDGSVTGAWEPKPSQQEYQESWAEGFAEDLQRSYSYVVDGNNASITFNVNGQEVTVTYDRTSLEDSQEALDLIKREFGGDAPLDVLERISDDFQSLIPPEPQPKVGEEENLVQFVKPDGSPAEVHGHIENGKYFSGNDIK